MSRFDNELKNLNPNQRKAVDTVDGPLLVVAGPGTGKTQLLAMRVANILQTTDTGASNILCLTFTNKAATNMRQRILQLTDNRAVDVTVKTFHSFASEIMSMYPEHFWNGAKLSMAPDALQLEIVQSILSNLPLDNPLALKFAGKYTLTSDITQALKLSKEAGLTPKKLEAIIEYNIAYIEIIEAELIEITADRLSNKNLDQLLARVMDLAEQPIEEYVSPLISLSTRIKESLSHAVELDTKEGKTKATGEWKRHWIQTVEGSRGMFQERRRNQWWLELSKVYAKYRDELHTRGYYDYADMLVEVITKLEANPEMRADIQERFSHVMIDEFQDTNSAQLRLAHLVADHHTSENNPNLMVVGDDDQSIFKFNGAELNNMLTFRRSYPASNIIVLSENYRSNQEILDLAAKVIENAEDRLTLRDPSLTKNLKAQVSSNKGETALLSYQNIESQLSAVAKDIKKSFTKSNSVAVIARGHASLRELSARLIALNVPIHYEQQRNVLDHPLVLQVLHLLSAVSAINNGDQAQLNVALSHTLRHPMWKISAKDLWNIAIDNIHHPNWMDSIGKNSTKEYKWIEPWLLEVSRCAAFEPLPVTLEYLLGLRENTYGHSPIKAYFNPPNVDAHEYLSGLSGIQYLRKLTSEYSSKDEGSLDDLISLLEVEVTNNRIVTDESPFVTGAHAVSLLTVHKAKGLEFDRVYVIDAIEKNWKPRKGGLKPPANLPLQPPGDEMDDYARLMYVAVTRAKRDIIASYYTKDDAGNDVLPTIFVTTAFPEALVVEDDDPVTTLESAITWPSLPSNDITELLRSRLDNYSLSVTHLLNFLDVSMGGPQHFRDKNLLRLPEAKTTRMAYGTAVHDSLEIAQKLVNSNSFQIGKVVKQFQSSLAKENLPNNDYKRYLDQGEKLLHKLFDGGLLHLEKGTTPEQKLSMVHLGQARLNGKLDSLSVSDNSIVVTDYKTGRALPSFDTQDVSLQIRAWKQRTQLIYYALLMQHSTMFTKIRGKQIIGQIIYLEADSPKLMYRQYTPTPEEISQLEQLILAVWDKIMTQEMPDISKYTPDYRGVLSFQADLLKD